MKKGITSSGFEFELDEGLADDMLFVEAMAEAMDNELKFPKVIEMLLGKEQKERLYDHIRGDGKRVSIQKTADEFKEIMALAGEDEKNS